MTFEECLAGCVSHKAFVDEWCKLRGVRLLGLSPIEQMIDKATGHDGGIAKMFIDDVYDIVWCRMKHD